VQLNCCKPLQTLVQPILSVTTIHDSELENAPSAEKPHKSASNSINCFILTQIAHCFPQQKKERKEEGKKQQRKKAHCYVTLGHVKTRFTLYPNELQI
jgi:hypothetical protein